MNFRHLWAAVVALSFLYGASSSEAATITVGIDGVSTTVPVDWVPNENGNGGRWVIVGNQDDGSYHWETSQGSIDLNGVLDPDPHLFFFGVALDFGAPSDFSYTFIMPLIPAFPNPSIVLDSFSGSVTNGTTAGGVTVTALPPPAGIPVDGDGVTEIQVYTLSDDDGVTWKNVGLDNGLTAFVPLGSFESGLYGNYNQGPVPTIAGGPWTHMRADVNFGLSGGGDAFTFNGVKVLIPEPSSLIVAFVLAGITCCGRPSRRNRK